MTRRFRIRGTPNPNICVTDIVLLDKQEMVVFEDPATTNDWAVRCYQRVILNGVMQTMFEALPADAVYGTLIRKDMTKDDASGLAMRLARELAR